jgi:formamidopyrimidine-DNA glycosylase
MFELPEFATLAKQINATLLGKRIAQGQLGNRPHKFVWYNRTHGEFEQLTQGKTLGEAWAKGKWLFLPLDPGYLLLIGECGGKLWYHPAKTKRPKKYHLCLDFDDGSALTAITQMWGAFELYERGQEQNRQYVKEMRLTPIDPAFTHDYFRALIEELVADKKRSAKSLLTQDQLIPGLGNAVAQDILFRAKLHPRHPLNELDADQQDTLYKAIVSTVQEVIDAGGRYDEYDLYGNRGGYVRHMDRNAVGEPCPECGTTIVKVSYLGGSCYFCPTCQTSTR